VHKRITALAALVTLLALPAAAQDSASAMAAVTKFVDSFNKGDEKAVIASCAERTAIVDEFMPHLWDGEGGCAKWVKAFDADAAKNGITDAVVTLHDPWHVDVSENIAYVVAPVDYDFKQKGQPVKETNSVLTIVLRKEKAGWRITAWTWAKH